jgi:hypothetical protein
MAKPSLKAFNDAFGNASKKGPALTAGHKEQLDKLQEIVDEINAGGTFKAEITKWIGDVPGLSITHKDDDRPVSFQIGFGHEAFSGSATIALSSTAARIPVGKEDGYALQFDREPFLKELGKAVAERRQANQLATAALQYATEKKAPKT